MTKPRYNKTESNILKSLEDAGHWAKGEKAIKVKTHQVRIPTELDVKPIRTSLGMSQNEFADRFGFSASTLRNWEQGTRKPETTARILLTLIEHEPSLCSAFLLNRLLMGKRNYLIEGING